MSNGIPAMLAQTLVRRAAGELVGQIDVVIDERGCVLVRRAGRVVERLDELVGGPVTTSWRPSKVVAAPLTQRERIVADLVDGGASSAAVARELGVSPRTVTSVRRDLRLKRSGSAATSAPADDVGVLGCTGVWSDVVVDTLAANGIAASTMQGPDDVRDVAVALGHAATSVPTVTASRWLLLTDARDGTNLADLVRRGNVGRVGLADPPDRFVAAVRSAMEGCHAFDARDVQQLVEDVRAGVAAPRLTRRESDMLEAIQRGEPVKQTARRLGLSVKTAEAHRASLFRKLGITRAREAAVIAEAMGLLR